MVSEKELLLKPAHLSWVDAASIPEVWITGTGYTLLRLEAYRPWLDRSASCIGNDATLKPDSDTYLHILVHETTF